METLRLLATDLDGTLIGGADEFPVYSDLRARVSLLREQYGAAWAICTGRSYRSFREFFSPMRTMGLTPDFVIVHHAFIYARWRFGYFPHLLWNLRILALLWLDRFSSRRAIAEWHLLIARVSQGMHTVRRRQDRLWLRFKTEEAAAYAEKELRERVKEFRHFRVFRYLKEVDVRSVPFTKGMAIQQLALHMGVRHEHILTIGDGHNDISALDGSVSRFCGCPMNAEPEVMAAVHEAGGHIASERSLRGVIEIVDAVLNGKIRSELPPWWEDPTLGDNPWPEKSHRHHKRAARLRNALLAVAAGYTVLLVFGSFGLLGPLSARVTAPYRTLIAAVERLTVTIMELLYRW